MSARSVRSDMGRLLLRAVNRRAPECSHCSRDVLKFRTFVSGSPIHGIAYSTATAWHVVGGHYSHKISNKFLINV